MSTSLLVQILFGIAIAVFAYSITYRNGYSIWSVATHITALIAVHVASFSLLRHGMQVQSFTNIGDLWMVLLQGVVTGCCITILTIHSHRFSHP